MTALETFNEALRTGADLDELLRLAASALREVAALELTNPKSLFFIVNYTDEGSFLVPTHYESTTGSSHELDMYDELADIVFTTTSSQEDGSSIPGMVKIGVDEYRFDI